MIGKVIIGSLETVSVVLCKAQQEGGSTVEGLAYDLLSLIGKETEAMRNSKWNL